MFETILYEVKDKIAHLTINRPESGNAFKGITYGEIIEAMAKADDDDNVDVVIITGKGKHFCAGGDIMEFGKLLQQQKPIPKDMVIKTGDTIKSVYNSKKPVIAAINGSAAGAGLGLALACDFIVMDENAKMHTAFIKMAFPGDTGLIYSLYKAIGSFKTREHVMLGTPIDAELADKYNLLYKVSKAGELDEDAQALAKLLSDSSSNALKLQKELFSQAIYPGLDEFNKMEAEGMHAASQHPDHLKAVMAFAEKRGL